MISVCIPVYNNRIDDLVKALYFQKTRLKYLVEIVVIDDASETEYKENNRKLLKYIDNYVELQDNIGRSKIRNLFLKHVSNQYLLFIDCDSRITDSEFLQTYLSMLNSDNRFVIVGGSVYSEKKPLKDKLLRWRYGVKIESKKSVIRNVYPYSSFITKNVLIRKAVLENLPFEESLTRYGHEDTLMGYILKKEGVPVIHVDNYVVNKDLDTNEEFLNKSAEAVEGLFTILDIVKGDKDFIDDVKLLVWVRKLYQIKIHVLTGAVLNIIMPFAEYYLKKGYPSLFLFSLFKLHKALDICSKSNACHYFDQ